MNKFKHLREKAVSLRENGYSLPDICRMVNKSKTTVYYWIKDVEMKRVNVFLKRNKEKIKLSTLKAGLAQRRKFKKIHNEHKEQAIKLWENYLVNDNDFKKFIMAYACEGDRKSKHQVGICNSNFILMDYFHKWFKVINFHNKKFDYFVQLHLDQDSEEIISYWKQILGVSEIKTLMKSNSGRMKGRNWNCKYGVLTIRFCDAYLKSMISTWMKLLYNELEEETVDSSIKEKLTLGCSSIG